MRWGTDRLPLLGSRHARDSPSISRDEVAHLANLARIDLTDAELDHLAPQLSVILESVASISDVADDDIPPTSHALPLTNVFRADVVVPGLTAEEALSGAPEQEEQRFRCRGSWGTSSEHRDHRRRARRGAGGRARRPPSRSPRTTSTGSPRSTARCTPSSTSTPRVRSSRPRASDARRAAGQALSPLDGVPIAVKDVMATKGMPTTCGSRILEGWVPPYDATVVARLREAGLPILGKTNMDEFAMGSSTEHSAYGPTRNPWDLDRIPGGSGGGSAAAVAAFEAPLAIGTDTGGSIRQPGAVTGTVGVKPTYGGVSRYGLVALANSLDQAGPVTRTVLDAALLHEVIGGHDPLDSTSIDAAAARPGRRRRGAGPRAT